MEVAERKFRGAVTTNKDRSRTLGAVYTYLLSLPRPEKAEDAETKAGGSESEEMVEPTTGSEEK